MVRTPNALIVKGRLYKHKRAHTNCIYDGHYDFLAQQLMCGAHGTPKQDTLQMPMPCWRLLYAHREASTKCNAPAPSRSAAAAVAVGCADRTTGKFEGKPYRRRRMRNVDRRDDAEGESYMCSSGGMLHRSFSE